jgi:hypothetical protein
MQLRFSLRSVVIFIALASVALWSIPLAMEWYKWRLVRGVVSDTMDQIAASPDKPAVYTGVAWHSQYCLANVEVNWNSTTQSGTLATSTPRSDAVFVEMPGKVHMWAGSADEVMTLIRDND